jgi:hypothetical protein
VRSTLKESRLNEQHGFTKIKQTALSRVARAVICSLRVLVLTWLDSSILSISLELYREASKVATTIMATTILTAVETGIVVNLFGSCLVGAGEMRYCWLARAS